MNLNPQTINKQELTTFVKKSTIRKQVKQEFIGKIAILYNYGIIIEVKRKEDKNSEMYIYDYTSHIINASSLESAISQTKKIARKKYFSDTKTTTNIPIIQKGLNLKERPNWTKKLKHQ
jgi:hypothetical protein